MLHDLFGLQIGIRKGRTNVTGNLQLARSRLTNDKVRSTVAVVVERTQKTYSITVIEGDWVRGDVVNRDLSSSRRILAVRKYIARLVRHTTR